MIKIAVLDDILSNAVQIKNWAESYFEGRAIECHTDIYNNPNSLVSSKNNPYAIYILDINLNSDTVSGIDIAQQLNSKQPAAQIIFVTAFDKYHVDVYEAEHIYTVPKAKLKDILPKALNKALLHIQKSTEHCISFSHNKANYQIPENQIRYMEKALRKVIIYADHEYECYAKFQNLLSQSTSENLVQCHKSYVVNTSQIKSLTRTYCVLLDNTVVPISKTYYASIFNRLSHSKTGAHA